MKKRIFTFLTLLVAFFGLIGLTTNNYKVINAAGNQTTVENDLAAITVPSTALISFPVTYKSVYGNDIDWTVQEGKENIIQYDEEAHWMVVNRPTEGDDEKVDITVTITGEGNATATKTFTVTVPVGKTVTKEYQISYELDGGTNNQNNPSSYHLGDATITLQAPTKEGYTFLGWYEGETKIEKIYVGSMQDYELTAQWTINTYTVKFNDYDGSLIKEETVSHGSAATAPADPSREGYTFTGWDVAFDSITSALTVTATYEINKYKVTFTVDDEEVQTGEYEYNSEIQFPTEPTKEGATFTGWYYGQELYEEGDLVPAEDITLVAGWSNKAQFTITFNTDGGSEVASVKVYEGSEAQTPTEPTKIGYTFAGWKNAEGEVVEFPYTPTDNVTLTAQWTINQYTITFNTVGGTEIASITQNYGTAVTAPADPTKEGYTFAGWDKEIPLTMPADDVTITAQWTINQYTITFNTVGGTEIDPITQNYGTAVTAPADPTKEGYTFAGWDEEIPSTMPAGNVTITAEWTINTYTFTYIIEGVETEVEYEYATQIEVPTAPSKDGYTFAGWNPEIPSTMPANDLTVTAVFTPNNMAEHIADEMKKVIEAELTESNLEAELKEAIAKVKALGGNVYFASSDTAISVDAEGNVTLIAPEANTKVTLTATVSHEGETTTATYRYFTVQLTGVEYGNITDQTNNVTIENVPTNAELTVEEVQSGNIQVEVEGKEIVAAYDITLTSGNNNLNGEFTVRIPVPQEYVDVETFYVYHVDGTNKTEITPVTIITENEIKYVQFTTTHFSVYALYVDETIEYTVTFNPDNENEATTQTVEASSKLEKPSDPEKEGYTFLGWYDGETEWNFENDTVTSELTLTAKWEEEFKPLFEDGTTVIIAAIRTSGNYFLMSSELDDKSRLIAVDSETSELNSLVAREKNQIWTIKIINKKYYLVGNNLYLDYADNEDNDALLSASTEFALNITESEKAAGMYNISITATDAVRFIALNNTAGNDYFTFYKSGQKQDLAIIPVNGVTERTNLEKVELDAEKLVLDVNTSNITESFTLPTKGSIYNSNITWSSNNPAITNTGVVTRAEEDVTVILTATLTIEGVSTTKEFTVTVIAEKEAAIYELVTDVSTLKAGDKIIIVASGTDVAMSTTQNGNNRGQIAITKSESNITVTDSSVQVISLEAGISEGTLAFYTGDGYLYAAGGTGKNNYLRTKNTLDATSSWNISITDAGIATIITSDSTVSRNTLMYNKNSGIFSCYASGQQSVCIYKLQE